LGNVPVTEYATPGTLDVPDSLAPFVKRSFHAALLANHGPVCWGRDITEAWYRLEALEGFAKISLYLRQLGGGVALTDEEIKKLGVEIPKQ
jgi:L-fuculose-phosphate aldolase